jgi:hypothetical protein
LSRKKIGPFRRTGQSLEFTGAVEVNRTLDLLITNQLLYQLSYNGTLVEGQGFRLSLLPEKQSVEL